MQKRNEIKHRIVIPGRRYFPIICVLVLGVALSFVIFLLIFNWEKTNQRHEFESQAKAYTNAVEITLNEYVEALLFLGDYFNNSSFVTRQEFTGVINSILPRYPGIQTFGWNPLVKDDERSTYESAVRKEGFDDFKFTERSETKKLVKAARREEYVVVYYLHPLEGNRAAFGFDIASNKTRLNAITKAFNTGKLSATDRITLVQETGNQFGILLLQPIYHQGVPLNTLEERHKSRKGFVVEVLRIGEAVETALKDFSDEGISLTLYDMSAGEGNRFLYHRPSRVSKTTEQPIPTEEIQKGLSWSKTFNFAERQWKFLLRPSDFYYQSHKLWQGWVVLFGLLLLPILLAYYMLRKIQYTTEIEQRVKKQNQTNQQLEKEIRERKQIEKKLLQAQKMEAIGTLAGGIAHDFNNILAAIMGYSEIIKLSIPDDSKATKNIDQVLKACNRAAALVQQILTFSRKSDHHLIPLAPHLLIKEALKMLRASMPTTIKIQDDIDSECGKVMADSTNIHQVIVNLCTNSLHAMENEKGVLSVSLYRKEISDEEIAGEPNVSSGPFIVLKISDTGHGMDQATIEQIFDPYYTTKEVGKGTGLGLSVIHGIIQDYHGFIRVESELGKGTTFYVHIPVLQQETSTADEVKTDEPLPTGTERILVVDDESMIANLNKTILEQLGYEVTATTQSLDALEKIRTDPDQFDLIITDQTMPNLTGAELAQEVLSIKHNMPIILCTGYSSVLSEEDALAIGIKKYVKKPVNRTALAKIVRQVMDVN